MIMNAVGLILFLSVCVNAMPGSPPVDCRKFVFAPRCRGASKRNEVSASEKSEPQLNLDQTNLRDLAHSVYTEMALAKVKEDEDENMIKLINKLTRDREWYGQGPETAYLKFDRLSPLYQLWSKRINYDWEYLPHRQDEQM